MMDQKKDNKRVYCCGRILYFIFNFAQVFFATEVNHIQNSELICMATYTTEIVIINRFIA